MLNSELLSNIKNTINWNIFTKDEQLNVKDLLEKGKLELLAASILNMDPEKEVELQKINNIVNNFSQTGSLDSTIVNDFYKEHPLGPETPEEELELQERLNEEKKLHEESVKKQQEQVLASLEGKTEVEAPEVVDEVEPTEVEAPEVVDEVIEVPQPLNQLSKVELQNLATERRVEWNEDMKRNDLIKLLNNK